MFDLVATKTPDTLATLSFEKKNNELRCLGLVPILVDCHEIISGIDSSK